VEVRSQKSELNINFIILHFQFLTFSNFQIFKFSNFQIFKLINMAYNLRNRNFLKLLDFTPEEIKFLLDLSVELKKAKYAGTEQQKLKG
jgi:hypothetical protein